MSIDHPVISALIPVVLLFGLRGLPLPVMWLIGHLPG